MGKLTDYKGDVMVEVSIWWSIEAKAGSLIDDLKAADPNAKNLNLGFARVCNDRIEAIFVTKRDQAPPESKQLVAQPLAGIDHEDRPICDLERGAYILGPINTQDLQSLIDVKEVSVQLTWSYREIFGLILHEWQQATGSTTLANRKDDDPLLAAISKNKKDAKYQELRARATLNAEITDHKIDASAGKPPAVQITIKLDLQGIRDEFTRTMSAGDWSTLSTFKAGAHTDSNKIALGLRCCFLNLQGLLASTVTVERGRKILESIIVANQSGPDAKTIVTDVRAKIDEYIIAANHWGEARESSKSSDPVERYQARLSDFFGTLYQKHALASPVNIVRGIFKDTGNWGIEIASAEKYATALWLQLGVGHCGEHAMIGFDVLRQIMIRNPQSHLTSIIHSGNANIDHAFVLVNLGVDFVFETRVLNPDNQVLSLGDSIKIFDLEYALNQPGNSDALVHDAYLQLRQFGASAAKLLESLKHKTNKNFNTTFVMFVKSHPNRPKELSSLDLEDRELKKDFPNI